MDTRFTRTALAVLAASVSFAAPSRALAHDSSEAAQALDYVPAPPKAFEGLGLTENLGHKLPLDLPFRDQDGKDVVLGDYFQDQLPAILTFNYSDCPMLCSLQLSALVTALPQMDFQPGAQFRIVTIDLSPDESPARARETRDMYIDRMPIERRAAARRGWTFLVARTAGDDAQIRAAAAAAGVGYKYVPERKEYAHPAALILLSSRGMITRYIGGTDYAPDVVRQSVVLAGTSEKATSVGFVMNCFHYEPANHAKTAVAAMRIGAIAFIVLFFAALGLWRFLAHSRRNHPGDVRS